MSEQEQFILNDIILRINPIDIQAFDQKFVERQTFIRENSTHAYSSKAALATYVATFAFDLNNAEDKQNLVSVCTELTKYPFILVYLTNFLIFLTSMTFLLNHYLVVY